MAKFVEVLLGKEESRIKKLDKCVKLTSIENTKDFKNKIYEFRSFLQEMDYYLNKKDTDLLSIRDDILANINQFLYLMTLE